MIAPAGFHIVAILRIACWTTFSMIQSLTPLTTMSHRPDLLPQAGEAARDQRLEVLRNELEALGVLLADDLDDLAAQPGPGQAEDLADQIEDARDIEAAWQRDAGAGERAEQPLDEAV